MAKQYRLKGAEWRAWRENTPQLLDEKGVPQRALTIEEEEHVTRVLDLAQRTKRNVEQNVQIKGPPERSVKLEVKVHPLPSGDVRCFLKVDGLDRRTTREVLSQRILEKNDGIDTIIKRPNNTFLKVVRNPSVQKPVAADANRTVPMPRFCQCRDWGEAHPGTHHKICPFNKFAPPEEQAPGTEQEALGIAEGVHTRQAIPSQAEGVSTEVPDPSLAGVPVPADGEGILAGIQTYAPGAQPVEQASTAVPPEGCQCEGWVRPEGANPKAHHYMCEFKDVWERHQRQTQAIDVTPYWLIDSKGNRVRTATNKEVEAAEQSKVRTGSSIIVIDGEQFEVQKESSKPDEVETFYLIDIETGERLRKADSEEVANSLDTENTTGLRTVEVDGKAYAVQSESQSV